MKINQPVTNVETYLPDDEFIYSSTDLKGVIVEANDAFARISNFAPSDMVGKPHNIVRHPDMPPAAFADLWRDLKAGRPWRGIVKNRRSDGGFYWVVANASPVRQNGQVVGYQSVRAKPSREEVAAATDAYARISKGDASLQVEHGKVHKRRPRWLLAISSVQSQMLLSAAVGLALSIVGIFGQLGGELPSGLMLQMNIIAMIFCLYFMIIFVPKCINDLATIEGWLGSVLSNGDLSLRLNISRRDAIGRIARDADQFVSSIQATIQGISDIAGQVSKATNDVQMGMASVQGAAVRQSEETSAAAASIEQVTVSIGEVAESALTTIDAARNAEQVSQNGVEVTKHASSAIQSLADTVRRCAEQVESLGLRSEEISRMSSVIKDIADQTNLLALNAAIEAARAGEQGRGFAVVADEVRKLAERTTSATQEIGRMTSSIQNETLVAVESMRSGAQQVAEGVSLVSATEESLLKISSEMEQTTSMVSGISLATHEQQVAMTELAQNVERVAGMTEHNVSIVSQTNATVGHLNAVVERMRKAVTQFTI